MIEKDILSQEEIDALLESVDESAEDVFYESPVPHHYFEIDRSKKELSISELTDVELTICAPVAKTKSSIAAVMKWQVGDILPLDAKVIETDCLDGDPMSILINGNLVAHGVVIQNKGKFSLKLTDIVSKVL